MKRLLIATALVVASAGAAFADTMENAYGNTVVVTLANGGEVRYQFNADQTYSVTTPDGQSVSGAYTTGDGQICLTPAGGEAACTAYVADKAVGDSWTQTGSDGSTVNVRIEAGR